MNWFKTNLASIGPISMKNEMDIILHGDTYHQKLGHWVVYRRFNRNEKSEYYSERTHEGVGGPAYKYTDSLIEVRSTPINKKASALEPLKVGNLLTDRYIYYMDSSSNPIIGDNIFEIQWSDHAIKPTLNDNLIYTNKYLIKKTHAYRLDNGNIQYFIASTEQDEVGY